MVVTQSAEDMSSTLLDTPLTWELLQADMQRAFNTEAKLGEGRNVVQHGTGNGFVSRICLVTFDWTDDVDRLPEKAIFKITGLARMQELCEKLFNKDSFQVKKSAQMLSDNEMKAYESAANGSWGIAASDLKVPKYYGGRSFGADDIDCGYIAIEHVDNVALRHMYHTVPKNGVVQVLKIQAKLHSLSLKHPEIMDPYPEEMMSEMWEDFIKFETFNDSLDQMTKIIDDVGEDVEYIKTKTTGILGNMESLVKRMLEMRLVTVLVHGDMWPANVLWTQEGSEYNVRSVIDWQVIHRSTPLEDVARFLNFALNSEDKVKDLDFYLDTYYETFCNEMEGHDIPFTKEEMVESYEKFYPIGTLPFLPMFAQMTDFLLAAVPEEEKESARRVFLDKAAGCVRDTAKYLRKWYNEE